RDSPALRVARPSCTGDKGPGATRVRRQHMSITEQAVQRVAAGHSSTIESAVWSITYQAGYANGLSDGRNGSGGPESDAPGYLAGYQRGYQWGIAHPLNGFTVAS